MTVTHPLLAPLGLLIAMVVIVDAGIGEVGFGPAGEPLALAVASAAFLAASLGFLLSPRAPDWVAAGTLIVLGASVVAMHVIDPSGPVIGLMLLAAFAPLRPRVVVSTVVTVVATIAFNLAQILLGGESVVLTIATDVAVVFFYLVGTLLRREQAQRERAGKLLVELEHSREAERLALQEAERSRVARDLHDVLAHTLSGLIIQLEAGRLIANGAEDVDPRLRDSIDRAHRLARAGVVEARRAVAALRGGGLPGADDIHSLVEEHRLAAGSSITLATTGTPWPLTSEASLTLYRVAQEALSNIRKHAPSAPTEIALAWHADRVELFVQNPIGEGLIDSERGAVGFGIAGMRERALLIGATVEAGPRGQSFEVRLAIPRGAHSRP